ncbi:hypothetical protein DUNSADRAFT_16451 [Dunaliella salina]|uniref:Uncharacterized protein n=1 Tax=Dunaliella salina TaxID=3046 RepID=A0ABQ7H0Y2_DUNSA|nr:hypothetical protein DUNSADRAFT_16451 [Dunaliella salina]|eukprot:KAF5840510.1 hypothetical protein DUNSADRAFT_16451 [Dunaliella salina]
MPLMGFVGYATHGFCWPCHSWAFLAMPLMGFVGYAAHGLCGLCHSWALLAMPLMGFATYTGWVAPFRLKDFPCDPKLALESSLDTLESLRKLSCSCCSCLLALRRPYTRVATAHRNIRSAATCVKVKWT